MVSLEQFHKNIWELFFYEKKTLEEALEVYESMSIESKSMIGIIAYRRDEVVLEKDKNDFEIIIDKEELENFICLCIEKEKGGSFDKELSEIEMFNIIFNEFNFEEDKSRKNKIKITKEGL